LKRNAPDSLTWPGVRTAHVYQVGLSALGVYLDGGFEPGAFPYLRGFAALGVPTSRPTRHLTKRALSL